ncbi:MAG TPA: hypothetical protein VHE55_05195 [Fimbriimonadaceae bacterium]|nr:hypothetical protein [Fimbriimonadaceae bacterium]
MSRSKRKPSGSSMAVVGVLALALGGMGLLRLMSEHPASSPGSAADLAPQFLARKERWGTKTGVGGDSDQIDFAHPKETTVADLIGLPRPDGLPTRGGPGSDRFGPVEKTAYTIDAKLIRYKLEEEDDQDFHIVITDYKNPGLTMIVEIPDPRAVDPSSPWRDQIAKARQVFEDAFHPISRFTRRTAHLRITGIGFFDFLHGQSGVAPNGIELHPVTVIEILD